MMTILFLFIDPSEWTADQTQCWVRWTLQQYQLSTLDTCMFLIPGSTLCRFTETDFRMRSMESGSTLYSQLEIWKNGKCHIFLNCSYYDSNKQQI